MKGRKTLSLLLAAVLLLSCLGIPAFAEETGEGGGFYLTVMTDTQNVIAPTWISFTAGQTVKQALLDSPYKFTGLEQGYIYAVEGVTDNFQSRFYDGNGFDLDVPASGITAMCITTQGELYSEELLTLIRTMGAYNARTDGVQNYPAAKQAYAAALPAMRTADAEKAAELNTALKNAIDAYDAIQSGTKYRVTFDVTQGGQKASNLQITMTDIYGRETTATGDRISVVSGDYTFVISDGGCNRTEGSVTVGTKGTTVTATLPSGAWFSSVDILKSSGSEDAYAKTESGANAATYYLPDVTGETQQTYLYAVRGDGIPDETTTRLRAAYVGLNGTDYSTVNKSWESRANALAYLVQPGMEGRTIEAIARYEGADGYVMIQSYTMTIVRTPTLTALELADGDTRLPMEFAPGVYEYAVKTTADRLNVSAKAFGSYADGYSLSLNGEVLEEASGSREIALDDSIRNTDGTYTITAKVFYNGENPQEYKVIVTKADSVEVTVQSETGVSVSVYNTANAEVHGTADGIYKLIPGETYSYVATKDTYYHTKAEFTAEAGLTITAATPITQDWLTEIAAANATTAAQKVTKAYPVDKAFDPAEHAYTYTVGDCDSRFGLWATAASEAGKVTIQAGYTTVSTGEEKKVGIVSGRALGQNLANFAEMSGYGNTAVLTVSQAANAEGVTCYQEYILKTVRQLHGYDMAVSNGGETVILKQADGVTTGYDRDEIQYTVEVPRETEEIELAVTFPSTKDGATYGGYTAEVVCGAQSQTLEYAHGEPVTSTLKLDTAQETEPVTVTIRHSEKDALPLTYTFNIEKLPPVAVTFTTNLADAVVYLKDVLSGKRILPGVDGSYALLKNYTYTYNVTCAGYVGQSATFTADQEQNIAITLEKAPVNSEINTSIQSEWSDFRGNADNNGITNVKTPDKENNAVLYWANQLGDGYGANAVGSPILVDGYLYTYAGKTIFKVDTVTGEIVKTGTMDRASSFSITPPTYAAGMIFVALSNGGIQAFNAETLESLWLYNDPNGKSMQPNTPITYHDGYVYTGFWASETKVANYVCLSVTDEDPSRQTEEKIATWAYSQPGGFYWAGAYVCDDYLLVGTDDGCAGYQDGYASLLSLNPRTGELLDSVQMPHVGDIRSTITHESGTNNFYFTSKGGYFYKVQVTGNGQIVENSLKSLQLTNGTATVAMSTSTPTVYNGRAYIGVSGSGQFTMYSGHNISVIDLNDWSIAYTVPTQGYPQTSGLLTTAYDEGDGTAYVYFFDNYTPGKLRVLSDKPRQTEPSSLIQEEYTDSGKTVVANAGAVLFTPYSAQAQYAICSPIVDEYGTIYFKNDSAYMMALGSTIEGIEITAQPSKTTYAVGETFDPTGMKVTATYTNGKTRDITDYVSFSKDPLTADDTEFQISFEHVMYQNKDGVPGTDYEPPYAVVNLKISGDVPTPAYTVSLAQDQTVEAGETASVTVSVASDDTDTFNTADIVLSYDADKLTYASISDSGNYSVDASEAGQLHITGHGTDKSTGTALTVFFTASGTSTVKLVSARIDAASLEITGDAPEAEKGTEQVTITVPEAVTLHVTLGDYLSGAAEANPNTDYTFTAAEYANYDYVITAEVGGTDITEHLVDNGDGSYTIPASYVTGDITLQASRTAKSYDVTITGSGAGDITDAAEKAEYGVDYTFTLRADEAYAYEVTISMGEAAYTGFGVQDGVYTIPGTDITGAVEITVTRTLIPPTEVSVIFAGSGAGDASGAASAEIGSDYSFTIEKAEGYVYAVSASSDGSDIRVQENEDGRYTISGDAVKKDITVTVEKTLDIKVNVYEYVKLEEKTIFLVMVSGTPAKDSGYFCDGNAMLWSEKYQAYAYLTIETADLDTEAAAEKITMAEGTAAEITYTGDINMTGLADINDVQLAYDLSNGEYEDFTQISVEKFLRADLNGDHTLSGLDVDAALNILLG